MASPAATITAHTAVFARETTHSSHSTTHATGHAAAHRTTHTLTLLTLLLTLLTCCHLSSLLLQSHSIHADTLVVEEAITFVSSHSGTSASHRTLNLFGHSVCGVVFASLAHVKSASISGIPTTLTIEIKIRIVQRLRITFKIIASRSEVEILRKIAFLLRLSGDRLHMMIVSLTLSTLHNKLMNSFI